MLPPSTQSVKHPNQSNIPYPLNQWIYKVSCIQIVKKNQKQSLHFFFSRIIEILLIYYHVILSYRTGIALLLTVLAMNSAGFIALHFQTVMLFIFTHSFQFYRFRPHCL